MEAQEVDALAAALDEKAPLDSHAERVKIRKSLWEQARNVSPPDALPKNNWLARLFASRKSQTNRLKGKGTSSGHVTAIACVLRSPEDFEQMRPGGVLVAVTTTPAWTPLFTLASAVVTDIGGPLSHSSIVAREYGIPAVMATGNATRRIRTGQVVTVDGQRGTVEILIR